MVKDDDVCYICCDDARRSLLLKPCKCSVCIHPKCLAAVIRRVPTHGDASCPTCRTRYAHVQTLSVRRPTYFLMGCMVLLIDTGLALLLYLFHDWNLTFCVVGSVLVACAYACVPLLMCATESRRECSALLAVRRTVYRLRVCDNGEENGAFCVVV